MRGTVAKQLRKGAFYWVSKAIDQGKIDNSKRDFATRKAYKRMKAVYKEGGPNAVFAWLNAVFGGQNS